MCKVTSTWVSKFFNHHFLVFIKNHVDAPTIDNIFWLDSHRVLFFFIPSWILWQHRSNWRDIKENKESRTFSRGISFFVFDHSKPIPTCMSTYSKWFYLIKTFGSWCIQRRRFDGLSLMFVTSANGESHRPGRARRGSWLSAWLWGFGSFFGCTSLKIAIYSFFFIETLMFSTSGFSWHVTNAHLFGDDGSKKRRASCLLLMSPSTS